MLCFVPRNNDCTAYQQMFLKGRLERMLVVSGAATNVVHIDIVPLFYVLSIFTDFFYLFMYISYKFSFLFSPLATGPRVPETWVAGRVLVPQLPAPPVRPLPPRGARQGRPQGRARNGLHCRAQGADSKRVHGAHPGDKQQEGPLREQVQRVDGADHRGGRRERCAVELHPECPEHYD